MDSRENFDTQKRYQVFLSHASADKEVAHAIADELKRQGIRVWFDTYALKPGDLIVDAIDDAIAASDYLVVLLSPNSVNSLWVQKELAAALSTDLGRRGITLLPVLIEDCDIPPFLASIQFLDLRTNLENGIRRLVEQIGMVPEIDFSKLEPQSFERLVVDLLFKLGFKEIEHKWAVADAGVDIRAEYSYFDPFGSKVTEIWFVETKFYRQARADLKSISQLVGYLSSLPFGSKGLLITNGQLTSAAKDWLNSAEAKTRIQIRVIDGTELKRLLLQNKELVKKYFIGYAGQKREGN